MKTMNCMNLQHDDTFPMGKVAMYIPNNGWVGTNNGWPHAGQPALYPEDQALAISFLWQLGWHLGPKKVLDLIPNPDGVKDTDWFKKWIGEEGEELQEEPL